MEDAVNQTLNQNDQHERNTTLVIEAINYLQEKNKGRYYENVVNQCKLYDWDDDTIGINIRNAITSGSVIEKVINSKPSLRVVNDEINVIIQDPVENRSTNTLSSYLTTNEFIDYKKYIEECIKNCYSRKEETISQGGQSIGNTYIDKYVESLEKRIISLERQNEFDRLLIEKQQSHISCQQQVIEALIHRSKDFNKTNMATVLPVEIPPVEIASANLHNNHNHLKNLKQTVHSRTQGNKTKNSENSTEEVEPKHIAIIGDSLLYNIIGRGLQKGHKNSVKVRSHPGSTTLDIIDHVRPEARKKPEKIVIMAGTNDLCTKDNINTIQNLKDVLSTIKDISPETSVTITSLPIRKDIVNGTQKVADLNNKIRTFAHQNDCDFIGTGKIDHTCLGQGKLHFNDKGNKTMAAIFIEYCMNV